jgi:hypothetical protein
LPNAPAAGLVAGIASKPWREDARFWAVDRLPRLSDRCRFTLTLRAACFAVSAGAAPGGGGPGTSAGLSVIVWGRERLRIVLARCFRSFRFCKVVLLAFALGTLGVSGLLCWRVCNRVAIRDLET